MRTRILILGIAVTACAVLALALQVNKQTLPPPYHTPSANNRPQVVQRPDGAELHLPQGFNIDVYAEDFERPRFMLLGPHNEVLISDSGNKGSVYVLRDTNNDFKADSRDKILDGLDRPYGLAFWKDYLYVAETTSVKRYKYDPKTLKVSTPGQEVVPMPEFAKGHWTRSILFNKDGSKFYLGVGSSSNVDTGDDPKRAAINRFNPDGSGHEILAAGTRNPIGLHFYPGSDALWAAIQERDGLGDDLVPDYFTRVQQGAFYGWPYAYTGPNEDPRRKGEKPDLVKKTVAGDVLLGAHVAVLDYTFYTGKQFPAEYQGGAFLANHGSWNRAQRIGYNVVFVPFKDGRPASGPREFLTGFMLDPNKREVWGRPVALLQLADGSLLLSDDGGNKIWRISYRK